METTFVKPISNFISVPEVAEYLGINKVTVYAYLEAHLIPGKKIAGRWFISRVKLEEFMLQPDVRRPRGNKPDLKLAQS